MQKKFNPSLQLFIKLFIVLALPFFLFQYVGNQSATSTQNKSNEGTRKIAIVNEDLGQEDDLEKITLGKNIPDLLSEQTDYSWMLMSRSAAEEGFAGNKFDAILYIPSNFTKNIMEFKSKNPSKAAITYAIEPNLEAKEHQRIYRQLANAKNSINQEMSSIYWSYVSQEVDNLKEQFDKILEKEIAFQDAMTSFYQPSSKTLADEIEQHRNQLITILDQTTQTDETLANTISNEASAQESIVQFADALQMYKDNQENQKVLLNEFQNINQEKISASMNVFNETATQDRANINSLFTKEADLLMNQQRNLNAQFTTIRGDLTESQNILRNWQTSLKNQQNEQKTEFEEITMGIVKQYNIQLTEQLVKAANNNFNNEFNQLKDPQNPDNSESDGSEQMDFEQLKLAYLALSQEIDSARATLSESSTLTESEFNSIWETIEMNLTELNKQLTELEKIQSTASINTASQNYQNIIEDIQSVKLVIIEEIKQKQQAVLKNSVLSNERKEELANKFASLGDLNTKSTNSLVRYNGALSAYQQSLDQSIMVDENLAQNIIKDEATQNKVSDLFTIDQTDLILLENKLGVTDSISSNDFGTLIREAEQIVINSTQNIEETMNENKRLINEMDSYTNSLLTQMNEVNQEVFEWEESPVVESLQGELLFQIQENTLSNLDNLAGLVSSLGENQNNITTETTDLQNIVQNVQEESNDLNQRWTSNIKNTEFVRNDAYDILGNTIIDGQLNPFVYDYLSNPVVMEGQINGEPLYETENRLPPVILFIIILLSGLLIGFLTQHYANLSYYAQGGLFILLTLAVGLIISIYGLNIYSLSDSQTILWSAFTILLLMTISNIVRAGLFIGPFVGWLTSILMTLFFITPMLNIIVAEFNFNHPIANVYMDLLYGSSTSPYAITMISLALITLAVSVLIYTLQFKRDQIKVESTDEETI